MILDGRVSGSSLDSGHENVVFSASEYTLPELRLPEALFIDDVLQQCSLDTFNQRSETSSIYSTDSADSIDEETAYSHYESIISIRSVSHHDTGTVSSSQVVGQPPYHSKLKLDRSNSKRSLHDPDLVTWDGAEDKANPHNWPKTKKWTSMLLVSMFTFISPMASTMVAPALPSIASEFRITSSMEEFLVMSIFLLAYAIGPFLWGPLSEVYGRVKVLQAANVIFLLFNTVCGFARTKEQMMAFRFLSGIGGSAPQAIGGGVLSDCFKAEERGAAISIYSLMPFISPAVAPIMGAYLTQYTTWRWVFWATSIFDLVVQLFCFFLLRETYPAAILAAKAKALRKSTGNDALHTKWQGPDHSMKKILMKSLLRPFIMLFTQPALQAMALFRAYQYGLMYLVLATFPMVFEGQYNQETGRASLNYLSLGVGFIIGLQISGLLQDKIYKFCKLHSIDPSAPVFACATWTRLRRRHTHDLESKDITALLPTTSPVSSERDTTQVQPFTIPRKPLPPKRTPTSQSHRPPHPSQGLPEHRLPLTLPSSLLISAGLLLYGFTAAAQTHWIVPNIGACIFAIGLIISFNCAQAYVVDTYTTYAASATGAAAFVRTMFGFGLPLAAPGLYGGLGVGWGNGVLGFVAIGLGSLMSIGLWRWGGWLRARSMYCAG